MRGERRHDAPRVPVRHPEQARHVATRELAAVQHGLEDARRPRRQPSEADLLLGPRHDAGPEPLRLDETFHPAAARLRPGADQGEGARPPGRAPQEEARYAGVFFDPKAKQDQLYQALAPVVARAAELSPDERIDLRGKLNDYVRLYAFLSQVLTFSDAELETLYVFSRHLRRVLPAERSALPLEVQQSIDLESIRFQETFQGGIALQRGAGPLDPPTSRAPRSNAAEQLEPLSRIIAELNERFGQNLGPEHLATLGQMLEKLQGDAALEASARVNPPAGVRLTFDQKVDDAIQDIVDTNFDLYKRITNDRPFGI